MELKHKGYTVEYTIEYRKRKSVEIKIDDMGVVRVRAPKGADESAVVNVIMNKKDWIVEKLAVLYSRGNKIASNTFENGESFLFLGKKLKLTLYSRDVQKANITRVDDELVISCPESFDTNEVSSIIESYYRKELKKIIDKRIKFYQTNFKVKPKKITIKSQKTKWGSCSSERNINFNWKLIMAPIEIIDYLVVHEMCHLVHMNHSKSFWSLVGKIMPDYKKRQEWLMKYGFLLDLEIKLVEG